ncbi:MAG TPA: hypothetical protein VFJ16_30460, partial [Longimicrobium sp.]|nr:hypothetical protein [Longimicrobium sp.]
MAKPVRDAAYWQRARAEMNAFHAAEKAKFDEASSRKREMQEALQARECARTGNLVDIRWNHVAVPGTCGPGGHILTVSVPAPRR